MSRDVSNSQSGAAAVLLVFHFILHTCTMASLNKLAIRGIRSFDDKQISVIEFYSPVTVIVGHNGSGKTVRWIV